MWQLQCLLQERSYRQEADQGDQELRQAPLRLVCAISEKIETLKTLLEKRVEEGRKARS